MLSYSFVWMADNSFAQVFKNEKTMWALQGIRHKIFISKNDRIALTCESNHRLRGYIGDIQDVYCGNSLLNNIWMTVLLKD